MKFTKEEARKELVAKLTEKGEKLNLSERTLNQQLETLIKYVANEEMELSDFITAVLPPIKELDGQYRKDNSDFVKEWEKNHPTDKPNNNGGENSETEKLIARINALEEENRQSKLEKVILEKKAELKASLAKKGVKDKEWIDLMMQKVRVSDDFDIEAESDFYLKLYNKSNNIPDDPYTPLNPSSGDNPHVNDSIERAAKRMAQQRKEEEELNC